MEMYEYQYVTEGECALTNGLFDKNYFQRKLDFFGNEGYRLIDTIYNSDGTWILVFSRPKQRGQTDNANIS